MSTGIPMPLPSGGLAVLATMGWLADVTGGDHCGRVDRHQARFNRVVEQPLKHPTQLDCRRYLPVIPLAVHQALHVQGRHILEQPVSECREYLVVQITPDGFRVFPVAHHLFFEIALSELSEGGSGWSALRAPASSRQQETCRLPLASPFRSERRVQPSDSWPDTAPASPSLACRPAGSETARKPVHFPMQKVEKMRFRMSSEVVWPVRESRAQRPR